MSKGHASRRDSPNSGADKARLITGYSPDSPEIDPDELRDVHLLAIAGTGMGSFAQLLQQAGYQVRGSDHGVWPPMSDRLRAAGISWKDGFRPENLVPEPDLVIVGNVVRRSNPEAEAMRSRRLPHLSFPEALGALFLEKRHSVVVAGTHGKTTTTAILAWVLQQAGRDPSFLIGGVAANLDVSARLGMGEHFVVEGDEYDTAYFDKRPKLLHYRPRTAVLTSVEFDHADIFRDTEHYESAFSRFLKLLPQDGYLAVCAADERALEMAEYHANTNIETYCARDGVEADWTASDLKTGPDGASFVLRRGGKELSVVGLQVAGRHNVENALAAAAVACRLGLSVEETVAGLTTFKGVARRQQVVGEANGITVVDDFAHHPTAVAETVTAVKARFPGRRLWAVFEPRTNTARRSIHQESYPASFRDADMVIVAAPPPHPDAIAPEERLDPNRLVRDIATNGPSAMHLPDVEAIIEQLSCAVKSKDVILVMSNGSFGNLPRRLLETLE